MHSVFGAAAPIAVGKSPGWNWRTDPHNELSVWVMENALKPQMLEMVVVYGLTMRHYVYRNLMSHAVRQAIAVHLQSALQKLRLHLDNAASLHEDATIQALMLLAGVSVSSISFVGRHSNMKSSWFFAFHLRAPREELTKLT
jgi:hypothetical protein